MCTKSKRFSSQPGGLPSMGSHRVGHDWSDLAAAAFLKNKRLKKIKRSHKTGAIKNIKKLEKTSEKNQEKDIYLHVLKWENVCTTSSEQSRLQN